MERIHTACFIIKQMHSNIFAHTFLEIFYSFLLPNPIRFDRVGLTVFEVVLICIAVVQWPD